MTRTRAPAAARRRAAALSLSRSDSVRVSGPGHRAGPGWPAQSVGLRRPQAVQRLGLDDAAVPGHGADSHGHVGHAGGPSRRGGHGRALQRAAAQAPAAPSHWPQQLARLTPADSEPEPAAAAAAAAAANID